MRRGKAPESSGDRMLVFSDASVKDGEAGIGVVIVDPSNNVLRVARYLGYNWTSSEAEAEAACFALTLIRRRASHITLYTDNAEAHKVAARSKMGKSFRNLKAMWVRSHSGQRWNEEADRLARWARKNQDTLVDVGVANDDHKVFYVSTLK